MARRKYMAKYQWRQQPRRKPVNGVVMQTMAARRNESGQKQRRNNQRNRRRNGGGANGGGWAPSESVAAMAGIAQTQSGENRLAASKAGVSGMQRREKWRRKSK